MMKINIKDNNYIIPSIKVILFVVLFCILCIIMNYLCKPKLVDVGILEGFRSEENNSLDVVYIGGSAAFVYYEPLMAYSEYGISSYVFGANTIQPELYKLLISEVIKSQNPKLIILDARAFQYRDIDQPPTEVAYRNTLTGLPLSIEKHRFIQKYVKGKLKDSNVLSYYFDFIKFHSSSKEDRYTWIDGVKMMSNNERHPFKGFYFVPKVEKQTFINYDTDKETVMSDETVAILDELLEYLSDKKLNVLFVVSPYIEQKRHKENFNYISRRVEEYDFKFLDVNDYRNEIKINYDTDFYNENHVNIFGADKYTKFMCEYIKSNYDVNDIRNNATWDELLFEWNLNKENTKKEIKEIIEQK